MWECENRRVREWDNVRWMWECANDIMGEWESGAEKSNLGTTCRFHDGVTIWEWENERMGNARMGEWENMRMLECANVRRWECDTERMRQWDTGRMGATAWSSPVTWCENVIYGYVWILYLILS